MTTPSLLGLGDVDRRHVFHPFSVLSEHESSGPRRMIVEGRGSTLTDDQGQRYIDAMAGLWCVNVGYGRPEIAEALKQQALKLPYYHAFSSMATDAPALLAAPSDTPWYPRQREMIFFFSGRPSRLLYIRTSLICVSLASDPLLP